MSEQSASPRFSVVIPLYNKAPHVERAIRSALSQSRPPLEIIVVDDGSSDGGLEIVHNIHHPSIRVLERSPPGPGGYAARNLGIRHAQGDWTAFLDADDLWHPSHLEDLANAIQSCSGSAGGAFTRFEIIDGAERRLYSHSSRMKPGIALPLAAIIEAWLDTKRCPIWTGACAFRTSLLIDAGLFPDGRAMRGGDKDMWLRAVAREPAVFVDKVSAEFHQDTVNRVTRSAAHMSLPVIVSTIGELRSGFDRRERGLLERLSNMEVVLYARHSASSGRRFDVAFFRALYPPFWRDAAKLATYLMASLALNRRSR